VGRFNGIPARQLLSDPVFRGDVSSNPTEQSYFIASAFGLKGSTADVYMTVVIDYWASFVEPRELAPSMVSEIMRSLRRDAFQKKEDEIRQQRATFELTRLDHFARS